MSLSLHGTVTLSSWPLALPILYNNLLLLLQYMEENDCIPYTYTFFFTIPIPHVNNKSTPLHTRYIGIIFTPSWSVCNCSSLYSSLSLSTRKRLKDTCIRRIITSLNANTFESRHNHEFPLDYKSAINKTERDDFGGKEEIMARFWHKLYLACW